MVDPFVMALDALFTAPGSLAATYMPAGDSPFALRVIRSQPDKSTGFHGMEIIQATNLFEIRKIDAPTLAAGDMLSIGGQMFHLGEPMLDVEGLTFTCGGEPVS